MHSSTRTNVRRTVAAVLAVLWVGTVYVVDGFLTMASTSLGWLWVGLAYAVGLVACAFVWGLVARVALGAGLGVALLLGFLDWQSSPPSHDRIAAVADDSGVPEGWRLASESGRGTTWCFKGCPTVERTYVVPGPWSTARDELLTHLRAEGWEGSTIDLPDRPGGEASPDPARLTDGRWTVVVSEGYVPADEVGTEVRLSFSG